ncbi:OmpP1/FadL family transporter [Thiolinea disciformis]|uniref:OmpP1/FadL family transporter n=1 Tax=Thiolinea disciformis TaxID=125614 RepID=UPI000374293C|nr:outer membrane protein transport protein [Thiolinea disciformis]
MTRLPSKTLLAVSLAAALFHSSVYAAGFALIEQSGSGAGNAYAGAAAVAEDAASGWFNPANLAELPKGMHISAAGHLIAPKAKFTNKGSWVNPALTGGNFDKAKEAMLGKNDDGGHAKVIPHAFFSKTFNDHFSAGVGMNVPFGLGTKYDEDWIGRYLALQSDITTININPAVAYKLNDKFTIGAGVNVQYMEVVLKSSIDSSATCLSIASAANNGDILAQCLARLPKLANAATDSKATITGDDVSYGYNLGMIYKPTPKTKIGISHRSKIDHDLEGDVDYDINAALQPVITAVGTTRFNDGNVTAAANLPATTSLSVAHQLNDKVEVLGDVTRTGWSSFERLTVKRDDATKTLVTDVNQDWKDSNRYALGVNYQKNDNLKLRAGVALDKTPIKSAQLRTARTPDNDRTWVAVGATYKLAKGMSVDVGYAHLFTDETPIDNTSSDNGYALRGLYDSSVDIVSAQFNWSF